MTSAAVTAPPRLLVDAHLDLEVGGAVHRLRGDGRVLRLTTAEPATLLAALPSTGRGDLADLADGLAELGLTVELAQPDGRVTARLGADAAATLGRVVTGSDHVELDALRLAAPAARARGAALTASQRRVAGLLAAAAVAAIGWLAAR